MMESNMRGDTHKEARYGIRVRKAFHCYGRTSLTEEGTFPRKNTTYVDALAEHCNDDRKLAWYSPTKKSGRGTAEDEIEQSL